MTEGTGESRRRLRVVVADDHDLFRRGLVQLLQEQGFDVVGQAGDGEEVASLVEREAPDVAVIDLAMPRMSGIQATRRIHGAGVGTRVVVLTVSVDEERLVEALAAGACGYLLKDAAMDQIAEGVEAAAAGESAISPRMAAALVDHVRRQRPATEAAPSHEKLTERELEVLRLMAQGMENAEIGGSLHISPFTVKNHISSILGKLGVENRIQAAVYAVRAGLL